MGTSKRYDLLVIGAGIIGLSAAYHIKENHPDISVLIIDRHAAPGQGDTAKSVAAIRDTFTSDVNRTLARSSIDFYKHIQFETGFNLNLELVGYLWLLNKEEVKAYEAIEADMHEQGMRLRTVERNKLSELIPDLTLDPSSEQSNLMGLKSVEKGLHGLDCGTIAPELIVNFYDAELRKRGVEFLFGAKAESIRLGAKQSFGLPGEPFVWQDKLIKEIQTNQGPFSAETYLVAAGIGTAQLLDPIGIDCMIKPRKNSVFQLRGTSLERLLATKGFNEQNTTPFTILPGGRIYFRPVPKERSIWAASAPGLGQPFKLEEEPSADESYYTQNIYPVLSEYYTCFTNLRPVNMWAGSYDVNSLDGTPIVEKVANCIVATGMSGSGIMKADAVGRVATAIFDDKEEARLFGDRKLSTSRLGLADRSVGKEEFVI
jgi:glycine/D-amino acid oxidase-like deaminating enzyme